MLCDIPSQDSPNTLTSSRASDWSSVWRVTHPLTIKPTKINFSLRFRLRFHSRPSATKGFILDSILRRSRTSGGILLVKMVHRNNAPQTVPPFTSKLCVEFYFKQLDIPHCTRARQGAEGTCRSSTLLLCLSLPSLRRFSRLLSRHRSSRKIRVVMSRITTAHTGLIEVRTDDPIASALFDSHVIAPFYSILFSFLLCAIFHCSMLYTISPLQYE